MKEITLFKNNLRTFQSENHEEKRTFKVQQNWPVLIKRKAYNKVERFHSNIANRPEFVEFKETH